MTRYAFILPQGGQEALLDRLQDLGLMDITRSEKPIDAASSEQLAEAELIQSLIRGIGRIPIPEGTQPVVLTRPLREEAADIIQCYARLSGERRQVAKERDACRVWGDFDAAALRSLSEAGVPVHFHISPQKSFRPEWADEYALSVIAEQGRKVYYVVAGPDELPDEVPMPGQDAAALQAEVDALDKAIAREEGRALSVRERIGELEESHRGILVRLDRYLAGAAAESAVEDRIVTLVGFAPSERDTQVCAVLDETGVFYLKEAAKPEDDPPIKLKNNKFTRMFEVLTDMYGRPVYSEFDPTPILGPFFLLFFAMCMGDAGYGILLVLIGWLLKKRVPSMAGLGPLVMTLGAGTFVVGIVLHTFFGIDLYEAAWIPDGLKRCMISGNIAGYDAQMVLAVGVGVFHICLATVVKAICYTQRFGFAKSISTWGWTLLIVGGITLAGLALVGVIDTPLVKILMIVLGVVSGLGIFLLNDLHRNPLLNIGSGLWDTYNTVTGLLGDVLSYLRLYALGLAGGMLGNTFNLLAGMVLDVPAPVINWLLFAIIILIGHSLNLALSCLGAFVHPLRLSFVEYFKNSGFEGSGRFYKPLNNDKQQ